MNQVYDFTKNKQNELNNQKHIEYVGRKILKLAKTWNNEKLVKEAKILHSTLQYSYENDYCDIGLQKKQHNITLKSLNSQKSVNVTRTDWFEVIMILQK